MQVMKRLFFGIYSMAMLLGLLTLGSGPALAAGNALTPGTGGGASGPSSAAGGGTATSTPAPIDQADTCVALSLPVLPRMQTCTNKQGQPGIPNDPATGGAIIVYLRYVLQLASEAVAAVVLLMLIISGVQYITSGANPGAVKAAKDRLTNALIALVLFFIMFAVLQFLVPGGIL